MRTNARHYSLIWCFSCRKNTGRTSWLRGGVCLRACVCCVFMQHCYLLHEFEFVHIGGPGRGNGEEWKKKKTPLFIFVLMSCVLCVCVHTGGRYADVCLVLCGIYVNRRVVCTIGDGGKNVWRLISIHIFDIHSLRAMDSFFFAFSVRPAYMHARR